MTLIVKEAVGADASPVGTCEAANAAKRSKAAVWTSLLGFSKIADAEKTVRLCPSSDMFDA